MERNPQHSDEGKAWILRFESLLLEDRTEYLDQEIYEYVIGHYLQEHDGEKALKACQMALQIYPVSVDYLLALAQAHLILDQPHQALEALEKAESLNCTDFELYLLKGGVLNRLGKHQQAIDLLNEHAHLNHDYDQFEFALGASYQQWGRLKEAIAHYRQVIANTPLHQDTLYELAYCLDLSGNSQEAALHYQTVLDQDPFSELAWHNLGVIYNKLGRYDKAIDALDYALALKEDYASALFNRGNAYMNQDKFEEAKSNYQASKDIDPQPDTLVCLGAAHENLAEYEQAITNYRAALKQDHQYDDAWYGIGVCLIEQERYYESIHFFNKALELAPGEAAYWLGLAMAEYETGNLVSSLEAYEQAVDAGPEEPQVYLEYSYIYYDIGDYERAISLVTSGIEAIPDNAELYYRAVAYMLTAGHMSEAARYLEIALTLDYDRHIDLYDFFPNLEAQKNVFRIIEHYKKK
jgi:tetratricopeptide (TPR) repeat protein